MTFTAPMFWHHQGPRAHQLADARSDAKGRTVLRKIRAGYTTISPQGSVSPPPTRQREPLQAPRAVSQGPPTIVVEPPPPPPPQQQRGTPPSSPPPATTTTTTTTSATNPPPYARPLPPTLPGYTALPDMPAEPARDLKQPAQLAPGAQPPQQQPQRRRYRDVLRRRFSGAKKTTATREGAGAGHGGVDSGVGSEASSDAGSTRCSEGERGVVLYRGGGDDDDDAAAAGWAAVADDPQYWAEVQPRPRGFRAWVKRTWALVVDWSEEHPFLFVLAIFVIVVVVVAVLI